MIKLKTLFLALLILSFQSASFAEDDLMSILEGKNETPSVQFVESEEVAKLKKAFKSTTSEQNIFFQLLTDKNYEKALFQWNSAFANSDMLNSETGKALESFLQFKNGLKITGVEGLFNIQSPEKIDSTVITLWKENLSDKDGVWKVAQVSWTPFWNQTFGMAAEMATLLQKTYVMEEVSTLTEVIKKTPVDSVDRNLLQWQLVLNLGIRGDASKAAQVLAHLMKAKNNPVDPDLMTLTAGRLLYQNGFLDAAIGYYQKISKKSDYWFQAQEEVAWAYMRKGEAHNAMAVTKTLTYPHFKGWVGIESYLLDAFSNLKTCNYPAVLTTLRSIKPQFSERLTALDKLSSNGRSESSDRLFKALKEGPIGLAQMGKDAHGLPSAATKDENLMTMVKRYEVLSKELELASSLLSRGDSYGSHLERMGAWKASLGIKSQAALDAAYSRIQYLAKSELEDSRQVIQRLRIVEVEMIQQVESASKLFKNVKAEPKIGTTGSSSKYAMNFSRDKEVWFDELSNFKVNVKKGCSLSSKE